MSEIIVVGSLNMDISITMPKVPVIGETVIADSLKTSPGGKGANQAVAAAKLGGQVSMVGCVGDDAYGKDLLDNLALSNVDIKNVKVIDGVSTGTAMISVYNGNNMILVYPGANSLLATCIIDCNEELIKRSSLMLIQLEIPMETVEYSFRLAKKHNVKVLLNPAPASALSDEILARTDIIIPNQIECEAITGIRIDNIDDARKNIAYFKEKGVEQVIITMGEKGVIYNRQNEIVHKPAYDVKVVDTTAAGDSFCGALSVAVTNGKSIDEAVDFANSVAAMTIMKKGAQTSLPTLEEVREFIKSH